MTLTALPRSANQNALQLPNPFGAIAPGDLELLSDRKHWTRTDCDAMEAAGILVPGEYELLDGVIVEKMSQNLPHSLVNKRVFLALVLVFGPDYVMLPVSLPVSAFSNPEPDVLVMQNPDTHYAGMKTPPLTDLLLAVEVSDSTLWRDLNTKMLLYAQAGVPEYWVLDINGRILWVHQNPTASGYADIQELKETDTALPQAAPQNAAPLLVSALLP